jgi:hypothetical protein
VPWFIVNYRGADRVQIIISQITSYLAIKAKHLIELHNLQKCKGSHVDKYLQDNVTEMFLQATVIFHLLS